MGFKMFMSIFLIMIAMVLSYALIIIRAQDKVIDKMVQKNFMITVSQQRLGKDLAASLNINAGLKQAFANVSSEARETEIIWETSMMAIMGEDGIGSIYNRVSFAKRALKRVLKRLDNVGGQHDIFVAKNEVLSILAVLPGCKPDKRPFIK